MSDAGTSKTDANKSASAAAEDTAILAAVAFSSSAAAAPNTAPVAQNDSATVNERASVTGNLLANDTDANGDTLFVAPREADLAYGHLSLATNGAFTYAARAEGLVAGVTYDDTTNYVATDRAIGSGGPDAQNSNPATLTVHVVGSAEGDANDNYLVANPAGSILHGQGGNDVLQSGPGNDTLDGGAGSDLASYVFASSGVTVNLSLTAAQNTGGGGTDTLIGIENIAGSNFADVLIGDGGTNVLAGGAGADILRGGGGFDVLVGGAGADFFILDAITDSTLANPDIIADFQSGIDKLDFRFVRASPNDKFTIAQANGYTYVTLDLNGDGTADARVLFAGQPTITAADILMVNPPTFTSGSTAVVAENVSTATAVYTAHATDTNAVVYGLVAGAGDSDRFTINATTGAVTFKASPDFEHPVDLGNDNTYDIFITATDGTNPARSITQEVVVSVSDANDNAPAFTSGATATVAENVSASTAVYIAQAVDADSTAPNRTILYSLTAGTGDNDLFAINAVTGVVTFKASPDFEHPTDAGADNTYNIVVTATDGGNPALSKTQAVAISVTDLNDIAPVFTSSATPSVAENTIAVVTLAASDSDTAGTNPPTFTITGGADAALFTITDGNQLQFVSARDYETQAHSYAVQVTANDGVNSTVQNLTVALTDVAPSTPVDANAAANTVSEGAANGTVVGITALATDPGGPAVTYSLTGDTSGGGFTINAATGVVTVADSTKINYESAPGHAYTVTAQASDGTLSSVQTFTIAVTDIAPSTPVDSNATPNTVLEGAASGTIVGITASSTDVNGPGVTYSLVGDTSGGGFTINATTGVVTVADSTKIDYESAPGHAYSITAQASDGTLSASQTFTIAVLNVVPTQPVDADPAADSVVEGAANGSTVGLTMVSSDPNGPAVTYSLITDSSGGGFAVDAVTGVVTVADSTKIDYESAPGHAYTINVLAFDGTFGNVRTFSIAVADAAPSAPVDANAAANVVAEGAANGTVVGITASSMDVNGGTVTYSISGDTSGGGFTINAATGVVTVADSTKINYETAPGHAYTITAQASDGTLTSSQTFTIAVSDVAPSTPVDSNAAANVVAEGAANGSTVGITVSSTDVNGPGVTYSLVGDTSGGGFTIDAATGIVTVADTTKIDYESAPGHAYTITAQASDGTLTSSQTFTIAVSDAAPSTPVDANVAANTVAEGAANGSTVGVTVSSSDPNGPAVTYALIGDTSGGGFTINATTGVVTVADSTKIDYESAAGHAYTITAQASGGALTSSQTFTIAVADVAPSTPVDSNAAANTVSEGAANGSTVGITASSTDVNGPSVTYSLIGDTSGGGFTINAATGIVTVADSTKINYETAPGHAYTITAQASDGTLSSSQTFTIAVSDVAPSTPVDSNAAANTVAEGAANGSTVGITVSSTDVNGPGVTYSLVGDTSGGGFTIDAATGIVTVADTTKIDYESAPGHAYTITAQASDGTLTSSQTFTIAVSDAAPSTPVDANAAANTVAEGAANGSTVGVTVSSSDPNGPAVTYALIGDTSSGGFTINATTGVVTVADSTKIDFETSGGSYTVVAQASDGTLTNSQAFVIAVTDVAPSTPVDSNGAINQVSVGAPNGSTVGVTAASSDVNGPGVTYSLVGDTSGGGFTINAATGVVTVADGSKILIADPSYDITVDASDGTLHSQQTFTIGVVLNSPPVNTVPGAQSTAEDTPKAIIVSVSDADGDALTTILSVLHGTLGVTTGGGATITNNSTATVTIVGTAAQVNAALAGLVYSNTADYNGADTLTVQTTDGTATDTDTVALTVTPVTDIANDTVTTNEDTPVNINVDANDTFEGAGHTITQINGSAIGVGGSVSVTNGSVQLMADGTLTFSPTADYNGLASFTYTVASGGVTETATVNVTVTAVNDPPVIDSDGGLATASININENTTAVTTVHATDQDLPAQTLTYSLAGGADQGKFAIDASTGVLTFIAAPNFEVPTDTGGDNGYDVIVRATDNGAPNQHDDQAITVHVQNVNEAPDTGAGMTTANEDAASIAIIVTGTDVDAGDSVASFHITNIPNAGTQGTLYSDAGLTTVVTEGADVTATGNSTTLYFVPNANFNTHAGAVTFNAAATDSHGLTDATPATETINVTAVDDAPLNNGVPANFVVQSGFSHTITGLSISDIDANEVGTPTDITTTLTSAAGIVTVGNGASGTNAGVSGGATVTTNASGAVVLTGSVAQINATLAASNAVIYTAADNAGNTATSLQIATDDHGHNGTGGPLIDTDTISIGVLPQVWFIDTAQVISDATAPRGSQANPFQTIHEFNVASGPGVNDYIYIKQGTYPGEGINLKDGQTLLGDDQALSFANPLGGAPIVIETASGARPLIHVGAGDQGIDLAQNNTIHGINIQTDTGATGLDANGNAVGTLTIDQMQISGGGQAVDIDRGGALNVSLESTSSTGGAEGIQLAGTASSGAGLLSGTFSGGTGAISGSTTAGFLVGDGGTTASAGGTLAITYSGTVTTTGAARTIDFQDRAASAGNITLSGTLSHASGNGTAVFLNGNAAGTIAFSGANSVFNGGTGTSDAVHLTNNTGATINFTGGGLNIDATLGAGFLATGGGTVNVTNGANNSIVTTTGTALNITNTNIGASNITFHDISAGTVGGGPVNGIVLNSTGTSGGLTVTGTGTTTGSGGTIQNTTGDSINLSSTRAISLANMNITDAGNNNVSNDNSNWIDATNVTGLTLTNIHATGSVGHGVKGDSLTNLIVSGGVFNGGGLDNDQANFNGFEIHNLLGTSSVTGATFSHSNTIQFHVNNDAATAFGGTPDQLTVSGTTWNLHTDPFSGDHLSVNSDTGGNFKLIVNNASGQNTFVTGGEAVQATAGGTNGKMTADISGVTSGGTLASGNNNTAMAVIAETGGGSVTYDIHDNTSLGTGSVAIKVTHASAGGTSTGKIYNNNITHVAGPGTDAIAVDVDGVGATGGTGTLSIFNNTISGNYQRGIKVQSGEHGVINATIHDNTLFGTDTTGQGLQHIAVFAGISGGIAATTRLNMFDNIVDQAAGATYIADYRLNNMTNSTFQLQDFSGNGSTAADIQAWVLTTKANQANGTGIVTANIGSPFSASAGPIPTAPLLAALGGVQATSPTPGEAHLTQTELDSAVAAAIGQWAHAGASAAQLAALLATSFSVADLSGSTIGQESAGHITIDLDAAGHGWFVDPTPGDNAEFMFAANPAGTDLYTDPSNAAAGHLDLLTAVTHELGHVLGLADGTAPGDAHDLMYINLVDGERRLPDAADVALAAAAETDQHFQYGNEPAMTHSGDFGHVAYLLN